MVTTLREDPPQALPMATSSRLLDRLDPLLVTLLALAITTAAAAALHDLHQTPDEITALSDVPPHLLALLQRPAPPPQLPPLPVVEAPSPKLVKGGKATRCGTRMTAAERQARQEQQLRERDLETARSAGLLGALR